MVTALCAKSIYCMIHIITSLTFAGKLGHSTVYAFVIHKNLIETPLSWD